MKPVSIKFVKTMLGIMATLTIGACDRADNDVVEPSVEYSPIEWTELIPKSDLEALMNPPEFLAAIVDGSSEDKIDNQIQTKLDDEAVSAYEKALISSNVVATFDGQNIRLPGFIVPLEFDENFVATEFFLVPYFGACLHSPPPPPNQIVFVTHTQGVKLESLEQPFWVSGMIKTESEVNDMAHSAYSMTASEITPYEG